MWVDQTGLIVFLVPRLLNHDTLAPVQVNIRSRCRLMVRQHASLFGVHLTVGGYLWALAGVLRTGKCSSGHTAVFCTLACSTSKRSTSCS